MQPVKLALVDDHRLFRQGLIQILHRSNFGEVVLEAASGLEFFDKLPEQPLDIVLLDLHMKDMDGKEVSRLLLQSHPELKIIILSMNYSPESILQLMRLGVHGYLPKDIDQTILGEAIEQVQSKGYYLNEELTQIMRKGLQSPEVKRSRKNTVIPSLNIELTEREMEVLELICKGQSTAQIADRLFISYRTVEGHRKNLLEKTGANNSVSLAILAVKNNLLELS
jgi:DNA-binding NarL/FixJ family response regulator